jgi:2-octaprenyl-6-methoxyphenol hydroxylase
MDSKDQKNYDVIIVGGGLVGLLQTLLLAQHNFNVLCIDKQKSKTSQNSALARRTTAISYGSHQLLKAAHLWEDVLPYACAIKNIEVLEGSSPTLLNFDINEDNDALKAGGFGWVIENHHLSRILLEKIKSSTTADHIDGCTVTDINVGTNNIDIQANTGLSYGAKLLIGADGRQSFIRRHCGIEVEEFSYNQNAIVSIVTHESSHDNTAIEHFRSSGPFAILPMCDDENGNHRSSIVWTEKEDTKRSILNFDEATYLVALRAQFPSQYGDIISTSERASFPLGYIHAHNYIATRIALIGDAAHGIHPIAGQGLNLGLRDIAALTELLIEHRNNDLGDTLLLSKYQQKRSNDNKLMASSMDYLNKLFSNNIKTVGVMRKIGLKAINYFAPAKKIILSQTMGTSGNIPDTIKSGKFK